MVMMEQAFWLILLLAVVGIAALIAAAMMWQKESIQQPGTPTGQRSYQEEYSAPDFTESAGFAVTMYPSTDILIPGRFWLINRKTAEIELAMIEDAENRGLLKPGSWMCRIPIWLINTKAWPLC